MPDLLGGRFLILPQTQRSGGGGDVFRAIDTEDDQGRNVAIKFVRNDHPDDPVARKLFEREVSSLSRLHVPETHPYIVEILAAGFDELREQNYIALEWIEDDFRRTLRDRPWNDWWEFYEQFARPLCEALSYAHLREVQHRDIKPANILVAGSTPKLADFGIAKRNDVLEPGVTFVQAFTRPYAPPDMGIGAEYSRDVWALAVVFIEAMSLTAILDYPDIHNAVEQIDVPTDVRNILRQCVDSDPEARPSNGSLLLQKLAEVATIHDASTARRSNSLLIHLTQSAVKYLDPVDNARAKATYLVQEDLSGRWFARYQKARDAVDFDLESIELLGRRLRYILKFDRIGGFFTMVAVRELPHEVHSRICEESVEFTGQIAVRLGRNVDGAAELGFDTFKLALDEHARTVVKQGSNDDPARAIEKYFDRLARLLNAREELAQGDRHPLDYTSRLVREREVTFELDRDIEVSLVGELWEVRSASNRTIARGEVVDQSSRSIRMVVRRAGANIPEVGRLAPNLGASQVAHDRQVEASQKTREGRSVRSDLRDILADPSKIRVPEPRGTIEWIQPELDEDKRAAVASVLHSQDLVLVAGPPGTGKTTMIAEVVAQTLKQDSESRILIVSQTHVAVDNALERLELVLGDGIVRLGRPEDPRVSGTVQHLLLDQQMQKWSESVRSRSSRYLTKISREFGIDESDLQLGLQVERLGSMQNEISKLQDGIARRSALDYEKQTATGIAQLLDRSEESERVSWLAEKRDEIVESIRASPKGAMLGIDSGMSVRDLHAALELIFNREGTPGNLLAILRLQAEWIQRIESDQQLASIYLTTARVVAGTCIGFLSHRAIRDLEFDLCILDEASKATTTEALVPLSRSKRWMLVGDGHQLPPMEEELAQRSDILEQYDLTREEVVETLFERLSNVAPKGASHQLSQQYRMVRPIGDLISACFYSDKLKSPRSKGLEGLERIVKPVAWFDTSKMGSSRWEERSSGSSHLNRLEARIAVDRIRILDAAIDKGLVKKPTTARMSVLLMAPYRRQIEELERELASLNPSHLDVLVQSVDAVQGREADIGIFCVTRSNTSGSMGFLSEPYWRRINVALSRAKFSLSIVGDATFCASQPGALSDVLTHIRNHPLECEIREVEL